MDKLKKAVFEATDEMCLKFCKYSNGQNHSCIYEQTHLGECPFKKVIKEIEECE